MAKVPFEVLLAQLPDNLKESLVVKTINGTEVAVQNIIWVDENYLLIRGRVAGTADQGLAYFIPIDRIEYLCVQKPTKDDEMAKVMEKILGPKRETAKTPGKESGPSNLSRVLGEEMREKLKALGLSRPSSSAQEKT
ncbi:MAG: hypothetical protein EXR99_07350 [Gemmataceae bacterium]|nr:hypothetical protein [Gemmataceae bacterium]